MKIGPLDTKPAATQPAERKSASGSASAASSAGSATEPSAQVALSSAATQISTQSADATFDTKKVERIAQAIRDGQFKVNHEAIADKLLVNAQELLGPAGKPN